LLHFLFVNEKLLFVIVASAKQLLFAAERNNLNFCSFAQVRTPAAACRARRAATVRWWC
jgi:hypothetical protein